MTADRAFGTLFALLGLGMFYATWQIAQPFPGSGDPGPRLLPAVLALSMMVLGVLLALRRPAAVAGSPDADQGTEADDDVPTRLLPPPPMPRRLGIGAAFVAFLALFEPLGFSLSSSLFLAISMSLMDAPTPRRILMRSLTGVIVVLLLGLLLVHVLKLPLAGVWFG